MTDCHVVSNDSDQGGVGQLYPTDARAVARYINSLSPVGVIDTGDCKDHYGESQEDELTNYLNLIGNVVNWGTVNAGANAQFPTLPGNHDELDDYDTVGGVSDFSPFDNILWGSPYRWTCDWAAPQIRFIAFHARILHASESNEGFFRVEQAEIDWVEAELNALSAGWKAIVCCHPPILTTFGNNIHASHGQTALLAVLAANTAKITAVFGGHRHINMITATQDSIPHFSAPGVSYSTSNSLGGFILIEYLPASDELSLHYRLARPVYGEFNPATYTTMVISR